MDNNNNNNNPPNESSVELSKETPETLTESGYGDTPTGASTGTDTPVQTEPLGLSEEGQEPTEVEIDLLKEETPKSEPDVKEKLGEDFFDYGNPMLNIVGKEWGDIWSAKIDALDEYDESVVKGLVESYCTKYREFYNEEPPTRFIRLQAEQAVKDAIQFKHDEKEIETNLLNMEKVLDFSMNEKLVNILKTVSTENNEFAEYVISSFPKGKELEKTMNNILKGKGGVDKLETLLTEAVDSFNLTKNALQRNLNNINKETIEMQEFLGTAKKMLERRLPPAKLEELKKVTEGKELWAKFVRPHLSETEKIQLMGLNGFDPKMQRP